MKLSRQLLLLFLIVTDIRLPCRGGDAPPATLLAARQNFHPSLLSQNTRKAPVEVAPRNLFLTVKYPADDGQLAAYLTPDPGDGKQHPAIVWITGGDCNSIGDIASYGPNNHFVPVDLKNRQEVRLRSPGYWLASIQSPTWVLEGTGGNISSLRAMARISTNDKVRFVEVNGASHFATLAPINEFIAHQILRDTGPACTISLSPEEVNRCFATSQTAK